MSWSFTSNAYLRGLLEKEAYLMVNIDPRNSSDESWYFYDGKYADTQYTWESEVEEIKWVYGRISGTEHSVREIAVLRRNNTMQYYAGC